jgi:shikimate dehydrogenase
MSGGSGPVVGVAGWPIAHSRSPIIHRHWLVELGVEGSYERFPVPPGEFGQFAASIGRDSLVGINVTAPHKEVAFAICDRRTPAAVTLWAVNTLWREGGRLCGGTTDVEGFLSNMDESAPGWAAGGKSATVIGAGGAARAIVQALISRGFERIAVVNRTHARAEALAKKFRQGAIALPLGALAAELTKTDLLVNASSLGMVEQPPLSVDLDPLPPAAIVADVVYVPLRTPLIEAAAARGLRVADGLGMLLHQAAPAFMRWFGKRPLVTPALRALVEENIRAAHKDNR